MKAVAECRMLQECGMVGKKIGPMVLMVGLLTGGVRTAAVEFYNPNESPAGALGYTFGYICPHGWLPENRMLAVRNENGDEIPSQCVVKARYADGTARHCIVSVITPKLASRERLVISLHPAQAAVLSEDTLSLEKCIARSEEVMVYLYLSGDTLTCSSRAAAALRQPQVWLQGPVCCEYIAAAPFTDADGLPHPHLAVQFCVRLYKGGTTQRVAVTIENNYAFEPAPQGYTYDVWIGTASQPVLYEQLQLVHPHHCRWTKVFNLDAAGSVPGEEPLQCIFDRKELLGSNAFPFYDTTILIAETSLSELDDDFLPLSPGDLSAYMPATGAQDDIGPLPRFAALYLLSMDNRAKENLLANGRCGGSFQIHYRDKTTGQPVSLDQYPYMTLLGNQADTRNPATGKYESFPEVVNGLADLTPDDAHQPSIAYVPYIVTGDYFYLEELLFWANWNMVLANPSYRQHADGLLKWGQVRAQAWGMRTLAQAAFIAPDEHPLKAYFTEKLENNIRWYTESFPLSPTTNQLGWLKGLMPYGNFGLAPWQDDFFTWSIGYACQLGFHSAMQLRDWKCRFPVGRMTSPGYCWLQAPAYSLQVGSSDQVPYASFEELYTENFEPSDCNGNVMDGYPESPTGYGANLQPALAVAVDAGVPQAAEAWERYQTRAPRQNYSSTPQFAVVPRSVILPPMMVAVPRKKHIGSIRIVNGAITGITAGELPLRLRVFTLNGRIAADRFITSIPTPSLALQNLLKEQKVTGHALYLVRVESANATFSGCFIHQGGRGLR